MHFTERSPAYNEQATIEMALDEVLAEGTDKELILVDDGSSDQTSAKLTTWLNRSTDSLTKVHRLVWLRLPVNSGKGTAIRMALSLATGCFVIVQDADLEVHPSNYVSLLKPLKTGTAEIVIGCRRGLLTKRRAMHAAGVWTLNMAVRFLFGYKIHDAACCFKITSLNNLKSMQLVCVRFEYCPEVIAKAARMGLRVAEVEIDYTPRTSQQGKKLNLIRDGFQAIATLWQFRHWESAAGNGDKSRMKRRQGEQVHEQQA